MQCLGEMTTWLPVPGAVPNFASRYVDGAVGFAVGWNVRSAMPTADTGSDFKQGWYNYGIGICGEIAAAAVIIQYWDTTTNVSHFQVRESRHSC